jgi:predicted TIM-barrel fold metal-dependent hydrolase
MLDDVFIFDGVVHVVDWSFEHLSDDAGLRDPELRKHVIELTHRLTGGVFNLGDAKAAGDEVPEFLNGTLEANYDMMFNQSPTDIAVVGNLPFFGRSDPYKDPEHSIKINHALAAAHPERCLFAGGVEPLGKTRKAVLADIERQVEELGACSMKMYPFHWKVDDRELAYPIFEKCQELGINVVQFHLFLPGDKSHDVEMQRPNPIQRPARDFPDLTFVLHHPMPLYFDETVNIAARFDNVYLLLSPLIQLSITKPRMAQHMMGELLLQIGPDRLIYGTEGTISGNPTRYIEAALNFEIADDLREGYGYPQMTREDKEKFLGLNLAKLLGVDVEAKKAELATLEAAGR